MFSKIPLIIICSFLILSITSCTEKFDKAQWAEYDHLGGSDRSLMAEDLLKNSKLIGLSNKQMLQLLGPPENDTTETWYSLKENYEFLGIDPVSGKNLIIKFNKDSVITHAEIQEWHKH